ncbi:neuroligin-3-like [Saccostrea cucullata]|uniref:neuroligin-3-like n=1 Tax=Saccostrea cuccullata TaxID=36930 RepID=UPI002ED5F25E
MQQETLYSIIKRLFVSLLLITISRTSGINIRTRLGQIQGATAVVNNVSVHQFLKIPFAKPPIGTLRFRKPEPFGNWRGTLKATQFGPSCMQNIYDNDKRLIPNLNITEDCLQLNVFVPGDIYRQRNLSVMIWVHGGSLTNWQGTMFNGSYLASRTNVIVVSINYRLNVFGFLYAGLDSNFKGHYGFFDQQLAFKWVKDNIEDFGGNSNSITIFGESAGGVSVTLHSIIPSNLGLFQRVIAESGSVMVPADVPVTDTESLNVMKQTAKLLHCSSSNIDETMRCLQSINASYLMAKYYESMTSNIEFSSPAGELFNQSLFNSLKNRNSAALKMLQSIDLMAGTNKGEAGLEYFELAGFQMSWGFNISANIPSRILCEHIAPTITEEWFKTCDDLSVAICHKYLKTLAKNVSLIDETQAAANLFADLAMNYPTFYLLQLHSYTKNNNTYQYSFAHKPTWELIQDRPAWLRGPNHASELAFVFGLKNWYPHTVSPTPAELDLSHSMMDFWSNFAKTGNPNTGQKSLWRSFDMRDKHYLSLDIPLKPGVSLYESRMDFWDRTIPNVVHACRSGEYIIPTSLGRIRGILKEVNAKNISIFRKVPYALPPLNTLRFAKPVPVGPWNGTLDSTVFGPSCVQFLDINSPRLPNVNMSEDCLHLNIYAPFPIRQTSKKAVMIWIHGGGFTGGQGTSIDGSHLALKGDVIVVTINYRLNIFGFFSTGSSDTWGNYGLYDQQLAIKWVKENILAFGGDPNRITLFGESAGGVSTTLQGVIPSNKGMFLRVIGESGSFLARRDYETKTLDTSHQVIAKMSCQRSSQKEILDCLRSRKASDLLKIWGEISWNQSHSGSYSLTTSIGPITDGELIPESPDAAMSNPNSAMHKQFNSIDLLVGTNTADAGLLYFNLKPYASIFKFNLSEGVPTRIVCDEMAPSVVREIYEINCTALVTAICKQYTPTPPATLQAQSQMAADLYGDFLEDVPTIKSLIAHASSTRSTFQYLFSRRPAWEVIGERPAWLKGANHASELPFVFGLKTFYPPNVQISPEEQGLADQMMKYWTNFAKYGNPDVNSTGIWKPYTVNSRNYIRLDLNITMASSLYKDRVHFWTDTVPGIVKGCQERSVDAASSNHYNISFLLRFLFIFNIINLCFS